VAGLCCFRGLHAEILEQRFIAKSAATMQSAECKVEKRDCFAKRGLAMTSEHFVDSLDTVPRFRKRFFANNFKFE
jgi:hypothetical protein